MFILKNSQEDRGSGAMHGTRWPWAKAADEG